MQKAEYKLIEEKFKGVYLHQQANFDIMNEKLEQIYQQTLKTNGRVDELEKGTRVVRFFENKPIYFFLIIVGLSALALFLDIETLMKIF